MLTVESKKGSEENIEVGGSNATIIVKPATLKMTMIEPSKDSYQKHEDIPFQITLLYPNEEIVENATITVNSSEQQQELTYQGNGSYQGFFISQETNQKNLMFTVHATDSYGNTVTDYQLVYIIDSEQGAVPLILVISLTGLVIIAFLMIYFLKNNIIRVRFEDINTEIEEIDQLQKEAVLAYYQKGSISRNAYERLRKEHEQRLAELQNKKMKKNNSNMK
jgi:hypothetical protein